jgi:hypothetical protein
MAQRLVLQLLFIGSVAAFLPNAFVPGTAQISAARHTNICALRAGRKLGLSSSRIRMVSDTTEEAKSAEKAAKLALARKLSDQAKLAMIEAEKAAMKVRVFYPPYYNKQTSCTFWQEFFGDQCT